MGSALQRFELMAQYRGSTLTLTELRMPLRVAQGLRCCDAKRPQSSERTRKTLTD
jgi:hypothetical protein